MESISLPVARRIALAAQGFTDASHETPTMRTLARTVERTGVLQVDSVNVLARAHYMPLYSRMGPYDSDLLARASSGRKERRLVEYWAHVQAFMPVDLWPFMRHRMDDYAAIKGKWGTAAEHDRLEASLLAEIRERGAATARDLDEGLPRAKEHWGWNWSVTRRVLDAMFSAGLVAIAGRNSQFEILYDVPERVLPDRVLGAAIPTRLEASTELIRRAARSHGVASAKALADYYRMSAADTKAALEVLCDAGDVRPVQVAGQRQPWFLSTDAARPRAIKARTLLSPFDPVVWERSRAEALFDFHYRIEIYVPAPERVYGYYVLPFLSGDRLTARVDLKADRRAGSLIVKGAFAEPDAPAETAEELSAELQRMAGWLGLDQVVLDPVDPRGDLVGRLPFPR